jgi:hypothetical protein
MKVIIDRFEGNMAVCEKPDRTMMNIPRTKLSPLAKEGDVLIIEGENIQIDAFETAKRKKAAEQKLKDSWE